ncbi:hypothetical protein LOTGIDRAFT_231869 [Lottia gigantea]|uniref:Chitin-binding type-2 domain-containing protein n=1 Tax=Lottia gigantea TaxID=225164 RepID=V3ZXC6_LOTGI|nr:hypothetical protein LOTGIDRAFT_231869 [Lottia gigantea]ESO96183.1 hypothetical protein LOTGIDRAFT_231869 [Lottia gigantea]
MVPGFIGPIQDRKEEQSAIDFCRVNPTMKFADPASCSLFFDCSKYEHDRDLYKYQAECVYLYLFDIKLKKCVYFLDADCQSRPVPRAPCEYRRGHCRHGRNNDQCIPCAANCVTLHDGDNVYPGRALTSYYLSCASGRTLNIKTCPDGLVFDPLFGPNGTCVSDLTTETLRLFCEAMPGQIIPHPGECAMYYDCSQTAYSGNFKIYEAECKYPNLFDIASSSCKDFFNVSCEKRREPISPCEYKQYQCTDMSCIPCNQVLPDCSGRVNGLYAVPRWELTSSYIYCADFRFMYRYDCPPGQVFDILERRCATSVSKESMTAYCNKYPAGRIGNPLHCAQYYDCTAPMSSRLVECPYPKLFSYEYMECQPFEKVDCGRRIDFKNPCDYQRFYTCSSSDQSQCPPCESLYPSCHLQPAGFIAALPGTTNQYYICKTGRAILMKCRTTFNTELMKCMDPESNINTQPNNNGSNLNPYPFPNQPTSFPNQPTSFPNQQPTFPNQPSRFPNQPSNKPSNQPPTFPPTSGGGNNVNVNKPFQPPYQPITQPQTPTTNTQTGSITGSNTGSNPLTIQFPVLKPVPPTTPTQPPPQPPTVAPTQPPTTINIAKPGEPGFNINAYCSINRYQIFPHPSSCAKYYNCMQPYSAFGSFVMECPYPALFDVLKRTCKPFTEVKCEPGVYTPVAPCEYDKYSVECQNKNCPPCEESNPSCKGKEDGRHMFPGDPLGGKYMECLTERTRKISQCPAETFFDPLMRACSKELKRQTIEIYCRQNPQSTAQHPFNCAQFIKCTANSTLVIECGYPRLFNGTACDDFKKVDCKKRYKPVAPCEYAQNRRCPPGASTCQPCEQRIPSCVGVPNKEQPYPGRPPSPLFVVCDSGRTSAVMQCLKNIFNPTERRCGGSISNANVASICVRHPKSTFPDPENCARYFNCSMKEIILDRPFHAECKYPDLYNTIGNKCERFHETLASGGCGTRYAPIEPCEYHQHCPTFPNCEQCKRRIPNCNVGKLNDPGLNLIPDNTATYPTEWYICLDKRTIAHGSCQPGQFFNSTARDCKPLPTGAARIP